MDKALYSALRVAFIYALFAGLWILFSDIAVESFTDDAGLRALAQTYKGLAFVVITALFLLVLVLKNMTALEQANDVDSLTGLFSINMFIRTLDNRIKQSKNSEQIILGYLDIDDFKDINQRVGFERADAFLRDLAHDIRDEVLPGSFVSRLHADQFASFGPVDKSVDMDAYIRGFQRLVTYRAKQHDIEASCSIGVAIYPQDGQTAKELMVSATEALKLAKQKKNAIQYHDKTLTEKANLRRQLMMELREAINKRELSVVYQPKYDILNACSSGLEVLVRWNHPTRGFISPDIFIPIAEEHDLTRDITRLVVSKAAEELTHSGLLGKLIRHVSVNVSATEFNNGQEMHNLAEYINSYPELSAYIRIEITETATLNNLKNSMAIIADLQQHGLTFSIDDFGTGYTSLAMLKDLTVDEIKIDRSFVSELETDARSHTIVSSIVMMANSFKINVVAEGVETAQQLSLLQNMGCKEVQGYYLGHPLNIADLSNHLQSENKRLQVPAKNQGRTPALS